MRVSARECVVCVHASCVCACVRRVCVHMAHAHPIDWLPCDEMPTYYTLGWRGQTHTPHARVRIHPRCVGFRLPPKGETRTVTARAQNTPMSPSAATAVHRRPIRQARAMVRPGLRRVGGGSLPDSYTHAHTRTHMHTRAQSSRTCCAAAGRCRKDAPHHRSDVNVLCSLGGLGSGMVVVGDPLHRTTHWR
jgi:hypothetical protein